MNNKGFTLNTLLASLGVLTFALVFAVILYDARIKGISENVEGGPKIESKNTYTYIDMEEDLVQASKDYLKEEYGKHIPEGSMKITVDTLLKEGFYDGIYDPYDAKEKCTGYVTVVVEKGHSRYHPYLKCGENYESSTP